MRPLANNRRPPLAVIKNAPQPYVSESFSVLRNHDIQSRYVQVFDRERTRIVMLVTYIYLCVRHVRICMSGRRDGTHTSCDY
jgi:nitrate reductase assembly molybdenum cofactor insertion protein NarJ